MNVSPLDVLTFLGKPPEGQDEVQIQTHIDTVTAMVRRYTRGIGFASNGTPDADLAAVIVTSTARLIQNPTMAELQTAGPFTVRPGSFNGWTLPELAVLHSYRRRAQ